MQSPDDFREHELTHQITTEVLKTIQVSMDDLLMAAMYQSRIAAILAEEIGISEENWKQTRKKAYEQAMTSWQEEYGGQD
nr:hypothetical protein [uncultured Mediterranean phage uvMED]